MPTVLVVDDEASIRELLRRILREGYTVADAHDGPSALAAISAHSPHVVFLDVHMPGENGLWLADQIQQQFPTSATVLATGDPNISTADRLRRGIISCLLKPFNRGGGPQGRRGPRPVARGAAKPPALGTEPMGTGIHSARSSEWLHSTKAQGAPQLFPCNDRLARPAYGEQLARAGGFT